jgi:hypothetical protein
VVSKGETSSHDAEIDDKTNTPSVRTAFLDNSIYCPKLATCFSFLYGI